MGAISLKNLFRSRRPVVGFHRHAFRTVAAALVGAALPASAEFARAEPATAAATSRHLSPDSSGQAQTAPAVATTQDGTIARTVLQATGKPGLQDADDSLRLVGLFGKDACAPNARRRAGSPNPPSRSQPRCPTPPTAGDTSPSKAPSATAEQSPAVPDVGSLPPADDMPPSDIISDRDFAALMSGRYGSGALARLPNLVGDGCAPGGIGSRLPQGERLVVVSQPAAFTGSELISSNAATLYHFPAPYTNIGTITNPIVPGAMPLATVPGSSPTIGFTGASGAGGTLSFDGNTQQAATGASFQGSADAYFQATEIVPPGQDGVTTFVPSSSGAIDVGQGDYSAFAYYDFMVGTAALTPGYNVGFVKMTENVSPLPRDRVYMNYSYFKNAFFSPQLKADVNRFMPGFEKTFLDGWTSIEVRAPFAATLDATQSQDPLAPSGISGDRAVEFGNMSAIFKTVLDYGETWAITGGTQVMVPTASDVTIRSEQGPASQDRVFIENQSTHVMPFLGAVWAPSNRFFAQGLLQVDVDANGNPVWANTLRQDEIVVPGNFAGRLNYPTFLYVGLGTGYWIYQDNSRHASLTGIAPLFEVHVNQALEESDVICFQEYTLGNELGVTSLVNSLVGVNFEWGQRSTLTFAYTTPIGGGVDRWFDGELRAMYNWRFGPQTRLTRVQF